MEPTNEQAARWAIRAHSGSLGLGERQELDTWLNADPRHRGAYVRARARWVDLDRLSALHGPARTEAPDSETGPWISRRKMLAASVAVIAVAGGGLSWILLGSGKQRYTSGIGEIRRIALADGSTMLLNTDTEATVDLTPLQREIRLTRGEALFEVAHDNNRPFVVHANGSTVRAVGTAFSVRLETAHIDITVTEGVVEVAEAATTTESIRAAPATPHRVAANEKIVIRSPNNVEVQSIAPADADRQLAWRNGMVSFDGESLQTAVSEINRHNRRQILIDDPTLAERPVVGIFRATDLDAFSAAAAAALQARVIADGNVIRLQPDLSRTLN